MIIPEADYRYILQHDLTSFIERSFYELNPEDVLLLGPHIELLAAKLEEVRLGKCKRLIINLPPRHLKSHCASVVFPAWILAHNPAAHIICASYGQELAEHLARLTRNLMKSALYTSLFRTRLSRETVHDFSTTAGGTRFATSVGGVLTGRGADVIIIDDPLKPDDALSEVKRNGANQWYDNTVLTRLNSQTGGAIIIIMQRLHLDDLVGHVQPLGNWEVLSLPAIAEEDTIHRIETPLGCRAYIRRAGEVLHPERDSFQIIDGLRQGMAEYNFVSQYQQNPAPIGGNIVKSAWLMSYDPQAPRPRFSRVVLSWDTASKANDLNDFSVCTVWGVAARNYYLLEVIRKRMVYPDLKRTVQEVAGRYPGSKILIEDKASGIALIQDLKREGLTGVIGVEPPAGMDKIMRLHAQTDILAAGRVYLPSQAPWRNEYVAELTSFPGSKYADQVDSTTQALAYMAKSVNLETWARLAK